LAARDGALENGVVQGLLAAEEVGGRTPRDAGRLGDLLQTRALEPQTREAILRGDQDRLLCSFGVSCPFGVSFVWVPITRIELLRLVVG
jgi:hypothetical protein